MSKKTESPCVLGDSLARGLTHKIARDFTEAFSAENFVPSLMVNLKWCEHVPTMRRIESRNVTGLGNACAATWTQACCVFSNHGPIFGGHYTSEHFVRNKLLETLKARPYSAVKTNGLGDILRSDRLVKLSKRVAHHESPVREKMMSHGNFNDLLNRDSVGLSRFRPSPKQAALILSVGLLIIFPDVVILIALKLLYVVFSWLSLMFKHGLQEAFDLSRHTAQMITAWLEVGALISFNIWLFRKLNAKVQAWYLRKFDRTGG